MIKLTEYEEYSQTIHIEYIDSHPIVWGNTTDIWKVGKTAF